MELETLIYDVDADGVALVTINVPDKLNALNEQVLDELEVCFREAKADRAVIGVVLTGAGTKSFVAGADIRQFTELNPWSAYKFALRGQAVFNAIEAMPRPVVAAINGYALGGGCELALACHIRVASENAILGQPEVNLGITPGHGATQRLPRIIGKSRATEMILTGQQVTAQRAYEMGLVNHVTPSGELIEKAKSIIRTIGKKAPLAVGLCLEAIRASELPLHEGLLREAALFGESCSTEDFREGVDAFLNRRPARFQGR